jgi:hypothetical protein
LFTDDFNYPVRDSLEGIGGWHRSGGNSPYNVKIVSPGLTYNGYPGSGIGNSVYFSNNSGGDMVLHDFETQTSGTLYMAFLISVDYLGMTTTQGYNVCFDQSESSTNHNTAVYIQKIDFSHFKFGIAKTPGDVTYENAGYNTDYTYLVVVKYMFLTGSDNDRVKLYVFYSGVPSTEPANSNAETNSGYDRLNIGQVVLSNAYAQTGLNQSWVRVDGIRVGTTWAAAVPMGITQTSEEVPEKFILGQNYPNPFNPETKINFSIPNSMAVKITVSDILGKQVAMLVNEKLNAGTYTTDWNASGYPSGVYFYRLEAENFSEVKKMILVK